MGNIEGTLQGAPRNEQWTDSDSDESSDSEEEGTVTGRIESTTTEDAKGDTIRVGDIVKTLSERLVHLALPPESSEEEAKKLTNQFAIIHEIKEDQVDIEIVGKKILTRIQGRGVKFEKKGYKQVIGDDTPCTIGSYVRVVKDLDVLKEFHPTNAWVHGMEETLGRTGRVLKIARNNAVLLQFGWGARYFFHAGSLLASSSERVQTRDRLNKWIQPGRLVQVHPQKYEFLKIQKSHHLPHEGQYVNLSRKFGVVQHIRLKPYSATRCIKIIDSESTPYFVHPETLIVADSVRDHQGNQIKPGDTVKLQSSDEIQEEESLTSEEERSLEQFKGKEGTVVSLAPSRDCFSLLVRVRFNDDSVFTLNPSLLLLQRSSRKTKFRSCTDLQEISREEIQCFQTLGEGAYGKVIRGEWSQLGHRRIVAVKQVNPEIASELPQDFMMAEAMTQFALRHPNIVTLYGISLETDLWLVMDFVDGWNLGVVLWEPEMTSLTLTDEKRQKLAQDMTNAIAYVHQKGYIHCDIKSINMLVERNTEKLYICDFGITRYLGSRATRDVDETQYTQNLNGTQYYIAPECLQRDRSTDLYRAPTFQSDVWSLGVVLYELIVGKPLYPFELAPIFFVEKVISNDSTVKKNLLLVPEKLRAILSRALDFDRRQRPTAQELSEFFYEYS